jgi:branched-chain amino acid transport system substrate-binding protein
VSDEIADEFLARYLVGVVRARHPGVMVDTTAWGDSNLAGFAAWLDRLNAPRAGVERFDQGDTNMSRQLERLRAGGADAIILAADTAEGAAIARGLATLGWAVPVVSHWGVSGGQFVQLAGTTNAEGVLTLQTFSFAGALSPKAQTVLRAYHARFGTRRVDEIEAPIGVAHGYDGLHLLARAIRQAGTLDGDNVRAALEHLAPYDGLIKRYAPAFTPDNHDPLTAEDCLMAVWQQGRLVPAQPARLTR